jgi:hypothetical protein
MPIPTNAAEVFASLQNVIPGEVTRVTQISPHIFRVTSRRPRQPRRRTQAQIERAAYRQMMREEAEIQREEERANRY